MATARPSLAAEPREITGKAVKHLREAGRLPAVVYGHGVESTNVTVSTHDFELLRRRVGPNALIDLSVDGKKSDPVLIHDVQIHPVNRRPLHADLFLVKMTEELTVDVQLVAVGTSHAVEQLNGTLLHPTETVRVKALPDHLPQSIEYTIESLVDFDASIYVRDLTIPDDVTLLTEPDEIIAKVQAPRIEIEEEPVAAEGEELEGEEAEGAEGATEGEGPSGEAGSEASGEEG
jgi:large subunit ribosomal protein L25